MTTLIPIIKESESLPDGFFEGGILYQGNWITWETYREINKVKIGGYIGDMISGKYVSTNHEMYQYCFRKELKSHLASSQLALLEGIKKEIIGMKRKYCTSGCGCSLEQHKMGHEGECVWRDDDDFNGAIDEIIAISSLEESITYLKSKI